jgi:thiamine-phosphate pyrophosphorylase
MTFDLRLYVILDTSVVRTPLDDVVRQVIDGGATMIQLRHKGTDTLEFYRQASIVRSIVHDPVRVIVNDRVDVAMAARADGVHLGTDDMPVDIARRLLGKDAIVGASANTPEEALQAEALGADYLGVGTVFPTTSKSNIKSVIGTEGLKNIVMQVHVPVVAIGGITREHIPDVMQTGAAGVAVISAVFGRGQPMSDTRQLRQRIDECRQIPAK